MRDSYMKHFTKFLAILHHNASFFNFCFIINFGFIENLLHIFVIIFVSVSDYSAADCHCLGQSDFPLFLVELQCKYFANTMHGLANVYRKVNNYSFIVVWQLTKIVAPTTSFFEKIMEICFIIASYLSLICLIMASYMRHGWI